MAAWLLSEKNQKKSILKVKNELARNKRAFKITLTNRVFFVAFIWQSCSNFLACAKSVYTLLQYIRFRRGCQVLFLELIMHFLPSYWDWVSLRRNWTKRKIGRAVVFQPLFNSFRLFHWMFFISHLLSYYIILFFIITLSSLLLLPIYNLYIYSIWIVIIACGFWRAAAVTNYSVGEWFVME